MARYPVAGCKIYIGGALADQSTDFVAGDFSAQTWVEIKEWVTMGDLGDAAADISSEIIGEARTKHSKGTRDAGTMENVHNNDPLDAGQIGVIAAEKTAFSYAFKVELNDKPSVGASPKNSMRYFVALVTSAREGGGTANTNRPLNVSLNIVSNIVRVAASPT